MVKISYEGFGDWVLEIFIEGSQIDVMLVSNNLNRMARA